MAFRKKGKEAEKGPKEELDLSVDELLGQKQEVENLLSSLEDEYRKANISEKTYNETKEKNKKRLEEIKKNLESFGISPGPEEPEKKPEEKPKEPPKSEATKPEAKAEQSKAAKPIVEEPVKPAMKMDFSEEIARTKELEKNMQEGRMEMEKMKVLIDTMKESRGTVDERIQRITETIGELRSMVFQREATIKEMEVKVDKLTEEISDLNPQQVGKEFIKRDKSIAEHEMKLEKFGLRSDGMAKTLADIKSLLESIGGLENIAGVNKDVADKMVKITQTAKHIERLTERVEKMFLELNKNMEEFIVYKAKQETSEEIVKELMKTVDDLGIRLEGYLMKGDINPIKEEIINLGKQMDEIKKSMETIIPMAKEKLPEPIQNFQKERETIVTLLVSLDDSFKKGKIKKESYSKAKDENQKKLQEIEDKLAKELKKFYGKKLGTAQQKEEKTWKPEEKATVFEKQSEAQKPTMSKKEILLAELEDSFNKGLLSKEAYEKTKALIVKTR